MNLIMNGWGFGGVGIPRVSGDEPMNEQVEQIVSKYSPRERG